MAVKAKLEQALASNTTYKDAAVFAGVVVKSDIRDVQIHRVGAPFRDYRRGPIFAVRALIVVRATNHAAGKGEIHRARY